MGEWPTAVHVWERLGLKLLRALEALCCKSVLFSSKPVLKLTKGRDGFRL